MQHVSNKRLRLRFRIVLNEAGKGDLARTFWQRQFPTYQPQAEPSLKYRTLHT